MFKKLISLKDKFIKRDFISYLYQDEKYLVLKNRVENGELIEVERSEFSEEELIKYIKDSLITNSLTYISTIVKSVNQGIVDSCSHKRYQELEIDVQDIKILCLKDFSLYLSLYDYDLEKKDNKKFSLDFLYSEYGLIHKFGLEENRLYLLIMKTHITIIITNKYPVYGNIHYFSSDEDDVENFDSVMDSIDDDILGEFDDDIADIDDLSEDIEEESEIVEDELEENDEQVVEHIKEENEIISFLQDNLKIYYNNYGDNFVEEIVILPQHSFSEHIDRTIENELIIPTTKQEIDILKLMNIVSKEELNV